MSEVEPAEFREIDLVFRDRPAGRAGGPRVTAAAAAAE